MAQKTTAKSLYEREECRALFKRAYEIFPDYNSDQAQDAADWIFDRLVPADDLPEKERDELYEMIMAGLT